MCERARRKKRRRWKHAFPKQVPSAVSTCGPSVHDSMVLKHLCTPIGGLGSAGGFKTILLSKNRTRSIIRLYLRTPARPVWSTAPQNTSDGNSMDFPPTQVSRLIVVSTTTPSYRPGPLTWRAIETWVSSHILASSTTAADNKQHKSTID